MTQRPKDMTLDELDALPIGALRSVETTLTIEDFAKGFCGKTKITFIDEPSMVTRFEADDILGYRSKDGCAYTFGQYADGTWYREPSFL